jgi:hypothetical protein
LSGRQQVDNNFQHQSNRISGPPQQQQGYLSPSRQCNIQHRLHGYNFDLNNNFRVNFDKQTLMKIDQMLYLIFTEQNVKTVKDSLYHEYAVKVRTKPTKSWWYCDKKWMKLSSKFPTTTSTLINHVDRHVSVVDNNILWWLQEATTTTTMTIVCGHSLSRTGCGAEPSLASESFERRLGNRAPTTSPPPPPPWELNVGKNIGVKSSMIAPRTNCRSTRNNKPKYSDDSSLGQSKRSSSKSSTPSTRHPRSTASSTTEAPAETPITTETRSTAASTNETRSTAASTTDAPAARTRSIITETPTTPRELVVGRPNFQINSWNYSTGRPLEHVLADIHKVSHWSEPNTNIINIDRNVYITLSEHYEIIDPNDRFRSNLSDVERIVVCHGSRNESPAAKLQRQLDLLYGLNLTILERQTEYKRKVRDAISRVIKAMLDLGVEGTQALRSDENNQAEAFSPHVIRVEGETWDDANRIGRKLIKVTSTIPCNGTPDLIQGTSALFTTRN